MTAITTFDIMGVAFSIATLFLVLLSLRFLMPLKGKPLIDAVKLLLIGYLVGIVGIIADKVVTSYAPTLITNELVQGVLLMMPMALMFVIAGIVYLQLHGFITAEGL